MPLPLPWRRVGVATGVVSTVLALTIPAALSTSAGAVPVPVSAPETAPAAGSQRVTLVTGDTVTVTEENGEPQVAVQVASRPDRRQVVFRTEQQGDDLYVVPSDAQRYVEAKLLDRELFNVRGMVRQGLTDARSRTLPLIVTRRAGVRAAALPGAGKERALPVVNGAAVAVDRARATAFWASIDTPATSRSAPVLDRGISGVHLDQRVELALDRSTAQVGAPQAWQAGYDGTGVSVAVLDSGVDASHPDLTGRIAEAKSFIEGEDATDYAGHGTHVASTIAGTGAASGGSRKGVAPGAMLRVGKVCTRDGWCSFSAMLQGMDWAARSGAKVVNMSLGGAPSDGTDILSRTLDELTAATGTLFVVAAGNDGYDMSVNSPGAATSALTVGAVDHEDKLAGFSSRGPRLGDGGPKPEIVAPGVGIFAARAAGTFPDGPPEAKYVGLSGTSMATPHVAGAAAILAQTRPAATAGQLKNLLVSTSKDTGHAWFEQGAGRLDIPKALSGISGPAAVGLGRVGTGPASATLTYTNPTDRPVTLALAAGVKGWDGRDGTASLSADELTVPAGGTADVTLTAPTTGVEPGLYGGAVTASSPDGAVSLRTAVSWYQPYPAPASHRLTMTLLDRDGRPLTVGNGEIIVHALRDSSPADLTPNDPFAERSSTYTAAKVADGTWVVDVPPGTYSTLAQHLDIRPDRRRTTMLAATNVTVAGPTPVTLDGRRAVPSEAVTGEPTYAYDHQVSIWARGGESGIIGGSFQQSMEDMEFYATPVAAPARGTVKIQQHLTLGSEIVRMRALGKDLATQFDPYLVTTKLAGRRSLPVVYAGAGSPAELAATDVRGKAVLVRLDGSADPGWRAANDIAELALQVAKDAAAAGAVAVLPYSDEAGALPTIAPGPQGPGSTVPLPVMSVGNADGERLRTSATGRRLNLDLQVRTNPERMYVLNFAPAQGIPASLSNPVDKAALTHTRSRFHADVAGLGLFQWWWGYRTDDRFSASYNPRMYLRAPAEIDHYVGPVVTDQRWHRTSTLTDGGDGRFNQEDLAPARGPVEDWFAGPVAPTTPEASRGEAGFMRHDEDWLYTTGLLTDSTTGHFGGADWGHYPLTHRMFRETADGDTEIPGEFAPVPYFKLAPDPGRYRLETSFVLPKTDWYGPSELVRTMSPRVDTTWRFSSQRPAGTHCPEKTFVCAVQPLIQLRYQLGLDLENRARAGSQHLVRVSAAMPTGSVDGGRIAGLTLAYSTDEGRTWRQAAIRPLGQGNFQARLAYPRPRGADTTVWLRTEAWDDKANRVTQTVHRAYNLR